MKVLVCGGRHFNDEKLMYKVFNTGEIGNIDTIIHGGCTGADKIAHDWAFCYARRVEIYHADWTRVGKAAGPLRNIRMLEHSKPDLVVAFPGGKGTAHMVKIAKEAGVPVKEIT